MMLGQDARGAGMTAASADPSMDALSVVVNTLGQGVLTPADEKRREATAISALRCASSAILKEPGAKARKDN